MNMSDFIIIFYFTLQVLACTPFLLGTGSVWFFVLLSLLAIAFTCDVVFPYQINSI
jgi:hypothetical protein